MFFVYAFRNDTKKYFNFKGPKAGPSGPDGLATHGFRADYVGSIALRHPLPYIIKNIIKI
jgi:hypothetical protein